MRNDGGPVFPRPTLTFGPTGNSYHGVAPVEGMSLRNYFAAQILPVLASTIVTQAQEQDLDAFMKAGVKTAYAFADAMIAEGEK